MHLLDGAVVETGLAFKEAEPMAADACYENDRAGRGRPTQLSAKCASDRSKNLRAPTKSSGGALPVGTKQACQQHI